MKPINRNEAPKEQPVAQAPASTQTPKSEGRNARRGERRPADQRRRLSVISGVLAGVTVVSLGLGAWQTSRAMEMQQAYQQGLVTVVTMAQDVSAGQTVESSDVTVSEVPERFAPADSATEVTQVVGLRANANLTTGNAVSLSTLQASEAPATLADAPEEGTVAYMVSVSTPNGLSPLLHVGDRVDVIIGTDGVEARVAFEDVRVLALDDATSGSDDDYSTITLELAEDEAVELYTLMEQGNGTPHLALRPTVVDGEQVAADQAQQVDVATGDVQDGE